MSDNGAATPQASPRWEALRRPLKPREPRPPRRTQKRAGGWSPGRLDYEFLEQCKEFICRIPHPQKHPKIRGEFRLSVLPWSQSAYVDLRYYRKDHPTGSGILLHFDVISALLPELVATVRRLEAEDRREESEKCRVEVLPP